MNRLTRRAVAAALAALAACGCARRQERTLQVRACRTPRATRW